MLFVPAGAQTFSLTTPSWGTTRPNAANGVTVTPGTVSEGSWTAIGSALTADAYGIQINVNTAFTSATPRNYVLDVGADPAGGSSYSAVITDLLCGGATGYAAGGGIWYYFPLFLKAGSTLAVRAQGTNASTITVGYIVIQKPRTQAQIRVGSFVDTLGISGGAIVGTSVTPGTTSEGSWVSLGTTSHALWWWQVVLQVSASDSAWNAVVLHVDFAVGDGTNKDIIITDYPFQTTTTESASTWPLIGGVEWYVPSGSTMYVRAQNSGANDTYTAAAYGCGG